MEVKKYYVIVDEHSTRWYKDAKCKVLHRENGPAIEWCNGTKGWYQNGLLHRADGPAIECADGPRLWCRNGQLHRTEGAAVEWCDGTKRWYINGEGLTEAEFLAATQPVVEMTVADVEKLVGKRVKIIK